MRSVPTYKTFDNLALFRVVVLIFVIVPLLGTVLAVYLLWERAVNWPDLALLELR